MVGLSIVLEAHKCIHNKTLHKGTFLKLKPLIPSLEVEQQQPNFLQHCFLCHHKLLPGKDIYMYKGDRGFCSVECRCRQIFMDEEESFKVKGKGKGGDKYCSFSSSKGNTRNPPNKFVY